MSPTTAMLLPMIGHAFLVFMLYGLLLYRRKQAYLSDKSSLDIWRKGGGPEPATSYTVNRNLTNQFELPMLFHPVCLALYFTDADNIATIILAWIFVATRYAHSFEHITKNRLRYRQPLFTAGFVALVLLWVWLAIWLTFE